MPVEGDIYIDGTQSNMTRSTGATANNVIAMEIVTPNDMVITDGDIHSDLYPSDYLVLGVDNVDSGTYEMHYFVGPGFPPPTGSTGTFVLVVECTTNAPTYAPTLDPTTEPTADPTVEPTTSQPTQSPSTAYPTMSPSTISPTLEPTLYPTTAAPTQPGIVSDGMVIDGDYNNDAVILVVTAVSECDAVFDVSRSEVEGVSIQIEDDQRIVVRDGGELVTVDNLVPGNYTVTLTANPNEYGRFQFVMFCQYGEEGGIKRATKSYDALLAVVIAAAVVIVIGLVIGGYVLYRKNQILAQGTMATMGMVARHQVVDTDDVPE